MNKETVAGYYRLSMEDEGTEVESNSITNQRLLIQKYISEHEDLRGCDFLEFYDDGISGTTMKRPGIQALLAKVKEKEIQCIIVKDLSRFSRSYIDLGDYMEKIFPFMEVRFIAITENYDSNDSIGKPVGIDIAFKGLLADFYCKDVSSKVRSSLIAKKNTGKYSTGLVPFGYEKNPANKMELIVVPEEAEVVKRIFEQSFIGKNLTEICKDLNDGSVLTPLEFKNNRKRQNRKELLKDHKMWQAATVQTILTNASYVGSMVYGKSEQEAVGSARKKLKPRNEWKVFKNHHVAIIGQEMYDVVQGNFFKVKGNERKVIKYPLKGFLYCGYCKRTLKLMTLSSGKKYFCCASHNLSSDNNCFKGKVSNEDMESIILVRIKEQLEALVNLDMLIKRTDQQCIEDIATKKKELRVTQEEIKEIKQDKIKLLEQYHEGLITKKKYQEQKRDIDDELKQHLLVGMQKDEAIDHQNSRLQKSKKNSNERLQYAGFTELSREMLQSFVKAVYVNADNTIDIHWTFNQQ